MKHQARKGKEQAPKGQGAPKDQDKSKQLETAACRSMQEYKWKSCHATFHPSGCWWTCHTEHTL
eukprot:1161890-Pelagomonas_calceolata.AAC.2